MIDAATIRRRLERYADDEDSLIRVSNRLALILAANQPFYPIYVWKITGALDPTLALTLVSTPFFLAAPWVAKRLPKAGRLYFPAVGAVNTFFCASIFGAASGVELFLLPCLVIAALSCRRADLPRLGGFATALIGAFLFLHGRFAAPGYLKGREPYEALFSLNAYSAAMLSAIAAWMFSSALNAKVIAREEQTVSPPDSPQ